MYVRKFDGNVGVNEGVSVCISRILTAIKHLAKICH